MKQKKNWIILSVFIDPINNKEIKKIILANILIVSYLSLNQQINNNLKTLNLTIAKIAQKIQLLV